MERKTIHGIEENSAVYVDSDFTKGTVVLAVEPSDIPKIPFVGVSFTPENTRQLIRALEEAIEEVEWKPTKEEPGLHKAVVTGIVQVIRFYASVPKRAKDIHLGHLMEVGYEGIESSTARLYILEWIKGGELTKEAKEAVLAGDYNCVWNSVNTWLKCFGYAPVESEEISPKEITYKNLVSHKAK